MAYLAEFIFETFWFLCWSSDAENPPMSFPAVGVSGAVVDCILTRPSDVVDPSPGVAVDWISPGPSNFEVPPRASDVLDPSLGLTGGVLLGRGLPSQGSLVDVERAVIIEGGR